MTKEKLALLLDGKSFSEVCFMRLAERARHSGLVAICGSESDIMLFGFFNRNVSCYDAYLTPNKDIEFMLHLSGVLPSWKSILDERPPLEEAQEWFRYMEKAHLIKRAWNSQCDDWRIETGLPHAKFVLKKSRTCHPCGEGIVIDAKDLQ